MKNFGSQRKSEPEPKSRLMPITEITFKMNFSPLIEVDLFGQIIVENGLDKKRLLI